MLKSLKVKREKIGGDASTWMNLTTRTKAVKYERTFCEQTLGGRIKRSRGIQLIIV